MNHTYIVLYFVVYMHPFASGILNITSRGKNFPSSAIIEDELMAI